LMAAQSMFMEEHNMKITEKTFNVESGEETIIEREETKSEKELRTKLDAEYAAAQAEITAKVNARLALLERLGITAEEAALLLE